MLSYYPRNNFSFSNTFRSSFSFPNDLVNSVKLEETLPCCSFSKLKSWNERKSTKAFILLVYSLDLIEKCSWCNPPPPHLSVRMKVMNIMMLPLKITSLWYGNPENFHCCLYSISDLAVFNFFICGNKIHISYIFNIFF